MLTGAIRDEGSLLETRNVAATIHTYICVYTCCCKIYTHKPRHRRGSRRSTAKSLPHLQRGGELEGVQGHHAVVMVARGQDDGRVLTGAALSSRTQRKYKKEVEMVKEGGHWKRERDK